MRRSYGIWGTNTNHNTGYCNLMPWSGGPPLGTGRQVHAYSYYHYIFGGKANVEGEECHRIGDPLISQPKTKPNSAHRIGPDLSSPDLTTRSQPLGPDPTLNSSQRAHRSPVGGRGRVPMCIRMTRLGLASELTLHESANLKWPWLDRDLTESSSCEYVLHLRLDFLGLGLDWAAVAGQYLISFSRWPDFKFGGDWVSASRVLPWIESWELILGLMGRVWRICSFLCSWFWALGSGWRFWTPFKVLNTQSLILDISNMVKWLSN
jgi:hypothetical protein